MNMQPRRRSTLGIVIGSFIEFVLPAIAMLVFESAKAVVVANIALWRNVPSALDDMAELWTDEALRLGWPSVWGNQIKTLFWWVALCVFLFGHILSSFITVWIVQLIFR